MGVEEGVFGIYMDEGGMLLQDIASSVLLNVSHNKIKRRVNTRYFFQVQWGKVLFQNIIAVELYNFIVLNRHRVRDANVGSVKSLFTHDIFYNTYLSILIILQ